MRDSLNTALMICPVLAGCSGGTPTSSSGVGNGSIVEVTDFRADSICGIQIHWTTTREVGNIGFNVYRLPCYYAAIWDTKDDSGAQVPEDFYDYTLAGFPFGQPVEITKRLEIVNTIP